MTLNSEVVVSRLDYISIGLCCLWKKSKKRNEINYPMIFQLFLIVFAFVFFIFLLLKFLDWNQRRKVYNIKTGEKLQGISIFDPFRLIFCKKRTKPVFLEMTKMYEGYDIVSSFIFTQMFIQIRHPDYAKQVLNDTETFVKYQQSSFKEGDMFFGKNHLVNVNGSEWKKQRNVLDPAFRYLENYEKIFTEKTKLVLNKMLEKNDTINNSSKFIHRMALDILGLSIFGHDLNSIQDSTKDSLLAYERLMATFANPRNALYFTIKEALLGKYAKNEEIEKDISIFHSLINDLIEKSKNKQDSKDFSMLDLMVASQDQDGGLSLEEIHNNVAIFFLAGHGKYFSFLF